MKIIKKKYIINVRDVMLKVRLITNPGDLAIQKVLDKFELQLKITRKYMTNIFT